MKNYLNLDPEGESYLYGNHIISSCVPHFTLSLTFDVDGEILRQTMQDIIKRFPQMGLELSAKNTISD